MATVTGIKLTRHSNIFDNSATLAELGLNLRPCADAIREEVRWLTERGFLELASQSKIPMQRHEVRSPRVMEHAMVESRRD